METNFETKRYFTSTGFMKHVKVTKENPRDFKVGDKFYWCWGGMASVDEVTEFTSQSELDELNGNKPFNPDIIDLAYNFHRCVRKIIE